jgi:hypothetical protein
LDGTDFGVADLEVMDFDLTDLGLARFRRATFDLSDGAALTAAGRCDRAIRSRLKRFPVRAHEKAAPRTRSQRQEDILGRMFQKHRGRRPGRETYIRRPHL